MPGSVYTVVAITIERFTTLRGENDKVIINLGTRELMCNFFFSESFQGENYDRIYCGFFNTLQFGEIF